jgi:hypothetical protein
MSSRFTYRWENDDAIITFELDEHSSLVTHLENFAAFLRACGYHIDGDLEVIKEEEHLKDWEWKEEEEESGAPSPIDYNNPYADKFGNMWRKDD